MSDSTLQFYDNYLPLLDAGDYTIAVSQPVGGSIGETFTASQPFTVVAPRFTLPPADVQSVFPPRNANGTFDENLPHVVLTKRALPWERFMVANDRTTPWLALLVLVDGEIIAPAGTTGLANPTLTSTRSVAELLAPAYGTLGPNLTLESQDDPASICQTVDISTTAFSAIAPRMSELPFLAHVREVDTSDKVTPIASSDGWFSVVIGNRFPQTAVGGRKNIVHLVSLEGWADYLGDAPTPWPSGISAVRLVSLASWSFICEPDTGNFSKLMSNLVNQQAPGGDGLRLRLPIVSATPQPGSAAQAAQQQIENGYTALEYETRVGDRTFAWYRGPFTPQSIAEFTNIPAYTSAAAATIYEPANGVFDLSYAAAWETGRMLALSDRVYTLQQQTARRALRRTLNLLRERTPPATLAPAERATEGDFTHLLASNHVSSTFTKWMWAGLSPHVAPGRTTLAATTEVVAPEPHLPSPPVSAQLRTLLGDTRVQATLQAVAQTATTGGALGTVTDWLARLRLLYEVPFANLVADSRMLPPESIRFFYVDPNYLDALADGAQSVALHTSRDAAQHAVVRDVVRTTARVKALGVRALLTGKPQLTASTDNAGDTETGVAGFLLRSAVVSGWPGLEVRGYKSSSGSAEPGSDAVAIDLVRMDHLAPDVLLCLFADVPSWIEIDEPREALAFGQNDSGGVQLRYITGASVGQQIGDETVSLAGYFRAGSTTVLDIAGLQSALQSAVTAQAGQSGAAWGPAAFALQMVRAPEQMIFQNVSNAGASNV
jgi:hypothetical protein